VPSTVYASRRPEGDGSGDPLEQKRLKRMRRNRESAAMSRNRKKAYIEELEAKVAALKASVHQLQSENQTHKQSCSSTPASAAGADETVTTSVVVASPPSASRRRNLEMTCRRMRIAPL
jgi:hypothetical protein